MGHSLWGAGRGADCRHLFGDVDTDRAPGDAAPAAVAAGGAELIDPARELVGHPLAITRTGALPDTAAMDVAVLQSETGIPGPHPLGAGARKIAVVLDRGAEAGRADHGAVAAAQAALGDLVPARMLQIALQQLLQPLGFHPATHLADGAYGCRGRSVEVCGRGRAMRNARQHGDTDHTAHLN